jgi:hypothetical protein
MTKDLFLELRPGDMFTFSTQNVERIWVVLECTGPREDRKLLAELIHKSNDGAFVSLQVGARAAFSWTEQLMRHSWRYDKI